MDPDGTPKSLIATVEEALLYGADAVSLHVNLGVSGEGAMLRDFGIVARQCERWGLPLLAMMYVRPQGKDCARTENIALAARIAAETGARFRQSQLSRVAHCHARGGQWLLCTHPDRRRRREKRSREAGTAPLP